MPRRRKDWRAPLLKLLRPYLREADATLDYPKFLQEVAARIKADAGAYTRLRKGIATKNKLRRNA